MTKQRFLYIQIDEAIVCRICVISSLYIPLNYGISLTIWNLRGTFQLLYNNNIWTEVEDLIHICLKLIEMPLFEPHLDAVYPHLTIIELTLNEEPLYDHSASKL